MVVARPNCGARHSSRFTQEKKEKRDKTPFLLFERVFLIFPETREIKVKNSYAFLQLFFVFLETSFLVYERFVKHQKQVYEKQPLSD